MQRIDQLVGSRFKYGTYKLPKNRTIREIGYLKRFCLLIKIGTMIFSIIT